MFYRMLGKLPAATIEKLLEISERVTYVFSSGSRMRIGNNAPHVVSKYHYSKWFEWKGADREIFRGLFPKEIIDKAIQCWFLKYDPEVGMLDEMTFAVNARFPSSFIVTALQNGQEIIINGQSVTVNKGEVLTFQASTIHEVKPSKKGQLWACIMIHEPFTGLKDL